MGKKDAGKWKRYRGLTRFQLRAAGYDVDKLEDPSTREEEMWRVAKKAWSPRRLLGSALIVILTLAAILLLGTLLDALG